MKRTELPNKFLKRKTDESRQAFASQLDYHLPSKETEKAFLQQS